MSASENVADDVFELPVAVLADDAQGVLRSHDERRLDRLADVRDAVRIRASQDADCPIRRRQRAFLRDVVVANHIHGGGGRDERDLLEFAAAELAVLDLDDVFPTHRLTRHVHRHGHRRGHRIPDPEDLQDLEGEPRGNVIDHGPVLDRGDAKFPHAPSPRIRSRSAMRTGTALKACLKYTACFVRSTSGAISVTRGSGCMMMSPRFASRRMSMSTRYEPATFSYSCGSGNRSFWIRVTYRTSASRITSSRRCVARNERPFSFTRSRISDGISSVGGLTKVRWAPSSARAYASEWTVRPYFRSPTRATFWPSKAPFSSQIVYRSRRVWVGCWPAPSPALMTGFSVKSAASRAAPSCGWRRTIASLYASTMRIVSARVSPFWTEVPSALLNPSARPPRRAIALSNESRVRVDGSKKSVGR